MLRILLADSRFDPSVNDNDILAQTADSSIFEEDNDEETRVAIVKLLLSDKRVDPSAQNNYPLNWCPGQ